MPKVPKETHLRNKFQKHITILLWKAYLQRLRRWKIFAIELTFAAALFILAVFIAKPVFLTPLDDEPEAPLYFGDILQSLRSDTLLGYAPNVQPYKEIMRRVSELLKINLFEAADENELNHILYNKSNGQEIKNKVMWIMWDREDGPVYRIGIKSTEVALFDIQGQEASTKRPPNPYLGSGYLAVQAAVSQAILEHSAGETHFELSLKSMPVSPLMQRTLVENAISLVLICYTFAFLPPVLETEALVVTETANRFKRALRLRNVEYFTMYFAWLAYAFLTAYPICMLGSIVLILIFRWVQLFMMQLILLAYAMIMMMVALIMSMYHEKPHIACVWTTLQTLLQTLLAELMVHHKIDQYSSVSTFIIQTFIPPFGLSNVLNKCAFMQTQRSIAKGDSITFTLLFWAVLMFVYFQILMLLQRIIGSNRAIGGQQSWKDIVFLKPADPKKLHPVAHPTGLESEKLQSVDEKFAKAISFRGVSKSIMGVPILTNVTFDIYRGEFSLLFAERIQESMMMTVEDLLTGLTYPNSGEINVLGVSTLDRNVITEPVMMGYCDHSTSLLDDLTVEEHFTLFMQLSLWKESSNTIMGYGLLRTQRLLKECDLENVRQERVGDLGDYYRAQLCWAMALLLEPRIIVVPEYNTPALHTAVIRDKIVKYRSYLTIVKITLSSIELQYADRLFLLDTKILAFGGTPAYMFFKFGREYRVRITFKTNTEKTDQALEKYLDGVGATVRSHLGALLILRMPTSPSANVEGLLTHLQTNKFKYGVTSVTVSLPDPEEVFKRAIHESRVVSMVESEDSILKSKRAIQRIYEPRPWKRKLVCANMLHLRAVAWKYFTFYIHYRFFFIITVISAAITGVFLGLSIGNVMKALESDDKIMKILAVNLSVESMNSKNTLIMRVFDSEQARSVANAYVLSDTYSSKEAVKKLSYIALDSSESLTEYLITQAIDNPQQYVVEQAYGIDIGERSGGMLTIQALYSPLHQDAGASSRSLARAYMALLRHYTNNLRASMQFSDVPLVLDVTPWMTSSSELTLLIQFLLVLTISHMTWVPSKEYGLIRHMQVKDNQILKGLMSKAFVKDMRCMSHAMNFSPASYWLNLAVCDLVNYWILVMIMSVVTLSIIFLIIPLTYLSYADFVVVPFMLIVYGVGCVPQAYLFSLTPRSALNSMSLIIVNIVFGEATIIAKVLHGDMYNYALSYMALSPQFNMAFALVKIRQIFLYNSECIIFKQKNLCLKKVLHKCCSRCGVLQKCFKRKSYFSNIKTEVFATLCTSVIFMTMLLLWEYRWVSLTWHYVVDKILYTKKITSEDQTVGVAHERLHVLAKIEQLKIKKHFPNLTIDTFGEHFLAVNVSRMDTFNYVLRNIYLGLGKGETLALGGMKLHGRVILCEMMAGYKTRSEGSMYAMTKYRSKYSPHQYAMHMALCGDRIPVPPWMTVYDSLEMIAILRGVSKKHVHLELRNYIEALDLWQQQDLLVCRLQPSEMKRLAFAAAVVGAPPVLILDECEAYQNLSTRRAMYQIINALTEKGHSIVHSAYNVESHMPISDRLAIVRNGQIYDIDYVDSLLERYSKKGMTVVAHKSLDADVKSIFKKYFNEFIINDSNEMLVNVQILDSCLIWPDVFNRMEKLKSDHEQIYSYVVCGKPIAYIYNTIISEEKGYKMHTESFVKPFVRKLFMGKNLKPSVEKLRSLKQFESKYSLTSLKELPWSAIFYR